MARLRTLGVNCEGWDPVWLPNGTKQSADVVNLGYVLNVIEDIDERAAALREAWNLSQKILVVAAARTGRVRRRRAGHRGVRVNQPSVRADPPSDLVNRNANGVHVERLARWITDARPDGAGVKRVGGWG